MRVVLLAGPPGCGAFAIAKHMASELAAPTGGELVTIAALQYGARLLQEPPTKRPFRAPHHTVSELGLTGGSWPMRPGELSLAHHGCLLLDELPEFRRSCVEAVGRVLRARESVVCRGRETLALPAAPLLVCATSHLCGCGWEGTIRPCMCKPADRAKWNQRLLAYAELLGVTEIIPVTKGTPR